MSNCNHTCNQGRDCDCTQREPMTQGDIALMISEAICAIVALACVLAFCGVVWRYLQ